LLRTTLLVPFKGRNIGVTANLFGDPSTKLAMACPSRKKNGIK
jgi:hypothetical protein